MNDNATPKSRPDFGSLFWRIFYLVIGLALMIVGRHWMSETDDATILPMVTMLVGFGLGVVAVRAWPRRARF